MQCCPNIVRALGVHNLNYVSVPNLTLLESVIRTLPYQDPHERCREGGLGGSKNFRIEVTDSLIEVRVLSFKNPTL